MLDAAGPGGVLRKAAQAVVPEVANNIADKLAKGTDSETWAPAAGIAASLLAGWSPRGAPRTPPEPSPLALPAPPRQPLLPPPAERPLLLAPEPRLALPPSRYKDPKQSWDGLIISDVAPPEGLKAYRVFGAGSEAGGVWLSLTKPTSASAAIQDFALQPGNTAQYYQVVHIPAGTRYQSGKAAAVPDWGRRGGGQQIELFERLPAEHYGPAIELPP
jgi:hypothetical protein